MGLGGVLQERAAGTSPLASGVQPGLTHNLSSPQGPQGYKGMVGSIGAAGSPVSLLLLPCPRFPPLDAASGAAKDVSSLSPCNLDLCLSFLPG